MSEVAAMPGLNMPPLNTAVVGASMFFFDETESTNNLALAQDTREDGAVFVAERQSAGRGRHGARWHSAPGLGLWFSVSLKGPSRGLMFAASLAVRDAARPRAELAIKWPNDLLCGGRKVCGILVEHREGWSAVGIGINVRHRPEDFPEELRATAGSLESATGLVWDRARLMHAVLLALDRNVRRLRRGGQEALRAEWVEACRIIGRIVRRDSVIGRVAEIDEQGALVVEMRAGKRRVITGDIEVVLE
ncbi:MAG TPA: biotin--[acetyl-CoA-carboxylase] ligase [Candidatus Hydrogenedentes bacterium]|nr:biotin--[acetyl-CoA-carboxylase] ligase [Candidatus Hydrogenedentota bacterium]